MEGKKEKGNNKLGYFEDEKTKYNSSDKRPPSSSHQFFFFR